MNKKIQLLLTFITFTVSSLQAQEFSFVSCNTLSNYPYEKYNKTNSNPMNLDKRIAIMENLFKENGALQKDIICLQECNLDNSKEYSAIKKILENQNYQIIDATTIPKLRTTNIGTSLKHRMATTIAYKKDLFEFDNPNNPNPYSFGVEKIKNYKNVKNVVITPPTKKDHKNFASVTLKVKNLKNSPSIKIQSWHIPPDTKASDHHTVITKLLNHSNLEGFTIFCGDFNYNSLTEKYKSLPLSTEDFTMNLNKNQKELERIMNAGLQNKLGDSTATFLDAAKQHHENDVPTAYNQGFNRLDYIFYTPNLPSKISKQYQLICTGYTWHPQDLKKLIKLQKPKNTNTEGELFYDDPTTGYFSDHAAIIAQFELLDTSTIEKLASSLQQIAG